ALHNHSSKVPTVAAALWAAQSLRTAKRLQLWHTCCVSFQKFIKPAAESENQGTRKIGGLTTRFRSSFCADFLGLQSRNGPVTMPKWPLLPSRTFRLNYFGN